MFVVMFHAAGVTATKKSVSVALSVPDSTVPFEKSWGLAPLSIWRRN